MGNVYAIVLMDEIPKFGSGHRRVELIKVGKKWVTLKCGSKTTRVPMQKWLGLYTGTQEYKARTKKGA